MPIEQVIKDIVRKDLDAIRQGKVASAHDEHVILANALWFLVDQLTVVEEETGGKKE